jgi:hypothetical protein
VCKISAVNTWLIPGPEAIAKKRSGPGRRLTDVSEIEVVQEVLAVPVPAPVSEHGSALVRSVAPSAQAMAVAAGGFVAGAAVFGLASRRRGRRSTRALAKRRRSTSGKSGGRGELVQILGTRSLLVDIHLLGGAER